MSCGSPVDGTAPVGVVLDHVRGDVQLAQHAHQTADVVGFIGTYGNSSRTVRDVVQHQQCSVGLGCTVGVRGHGFGNQPAAVLRHDVAQITEPGFLAFRLPVEPRIRIGGGCVRLVGALLALKIPAVARVVAASVLAPKALVAGPCFDQP